MSSNKFISSSLLYFLDQSLLTIGNWVLWLFFSKLISAYEIGLATTVYNFFLLVSTLVQLGIEFPVLKKSSIHDSRILATSFIIQLIVATAFLPLVIYFFASNQSLLIFMPITIAMVLLCSLSLSRFVLLGVSSVKAVLIIDAVSTILRFVASLSLIQIASGSFALVFSLLIQFLFMTAITSIKAFNIFGFKLGDASYYKEITYDTLANSPAKLSRALVPTLSITLLAALGTNSSEIGIFYVALIISIAAGGLMSSISYIILPASFKLSTDLSFQGMRIGLSLTSPIIAALVTSPKYILSLIGTQYTSAEQVLLILSFGVLPSIIVMGLVTKLNYLGKIWKIALLGILQISSFLITFAVLTPYSEVLGMAFAISISSIASAAAILWQGRQVLMQIVKCIISIIMGCLFGYIIQYLGSGEVTLQLFSMLISMSITFVMVILLKNISITEFSGLYKHRR